MTNSEMEEKISKSVEEIESSKLLYFLLKLVQHQESNKQDWSN
ncbi:hypothetical protein [Enterococcus sp. 5H]|nr:hypothetical protein [Enterococcus sp. 5H]MDA9472284.1 hypothetical protein [Enterococcus sp. 5H]